MSMIEKIGRLMIGYPAEVEISLGLLAALIVTVLITRAMRNGKKKKELLSQINDTVCQINSTVNEMGIKKSDVIYIDNRASKGDAGDAKVDFLSLGEREAVAEGAELELEETAIPPVAEEAAEESVSGQVKYFDRDCAVDKHGKIYTVEELKEQILM